MNFLKLKVDATDCLYLNPLEVVAVQENYSAPSEPKSIIQVKKGFSYIDHPAEHIAKALLLAADTSIVDGRILELQDDGSIRVVGELARLKEAKPQFDTVMLPD